MKIRIVVIVFFALIISLSACDTSQNGEITVYYADNAQFELIDANGNRVLIDIYNPDLLSSPVMEKDILLTTHGHQDHLNSAFQSEFPGQQLYMQVGKISQPEIEVLGLASTHTAYGSDEFKDKNGSNYIYIIDMGGMRIAHFGDIGQDELTPDQLSNLGEVDIALTQFVNSFGQMDTNNQKGFHLMEQVKPKFIIPTHGNGNMDAMGYATEIWDAYASPSNSFIVRSADLSETPKFVIVGVAAKSMEAIYDLPVWSAE